MTTVVRTLTGWARTAPTKARTTPEMVRQMYPRLDEWRKIRTAVDPDAIFRSDLSRRLSL